MLALMKRIAAAALIVSFAAPVAASERHFTYTYESQVLNPGDVELEPWTTLRAGREDFYHRYDLRLELEVGVIENLQTALYWNMSSIAEDVEVENADDEREVSFEFTGVSSEWKYKLTDSVADALGSALYFEATAAPTEAELEAKLILDKRIGPWLVAFNAVAEYEWEFEEPGETERELVLAPVLGAGYFFAPRFMAGLEVRSHTELGDGGSEYEHTAFFAGPVAAYAADSWWAALTVLPQIAAIKGDDEDDADEGQSSLELEEHERIEVRLLLGFHL